MPFGPWATVEQCIQLACQLNMLEWIYREPASEQAPWPTPEDMPFTQGLHRRRLALARSSEMQLLLVSLPVKGMTVLEGMMEVQGRDQLRDHLAWLLSHGVSKKRMAKQSTKVLLDLYVKEATCSHRLQGLWAYLGALVSRAGSWALGEMQSPLRDCPSVSCF